ncbi:unnamed protein product [Linum tenue]|uniref:Uncharacterized protein n=1 Tax=Linum tenue TaxID=586396 RepID=A0AAV0IMA4_9ROSI|nr:unnamed protein product [Linum tenue]
MSSAMDVWALGFATSTKKLSGESRTQKEEASVEKADNGKVAEALPAAPAEAAPVKSIAMSSAMDVWALGFATSTVKLSGESGTREEEGSVEKADNCVAGKVAEAVPAAPAKSIPMSCAMDVWALGFATSTKELSGESRTREEVPVEKAENGGKVHEAVPAAPAEAASTKSIPMSCAMDVWGGKVHKAAPAAPAEAAAVKSTAMSCAMDVWALGFATSTKELSGAKVYKAAPAAPAVAAPATPAEAASTKSIAMSSAMDVWALGFATSTEEISGKVHKAKPASPAKAKPGTPAEAAAAKPEAAKPKSKAAGMPAKPENESDDDESGEDMSVDHDDDREDVEIPSSKKPQQGKKRSNDSALETTVPAKKAKQNTPAKTEGKNSGHTDTPHPEKNAGSDAKNPELG